MPQQKTRKAIANILIQAHYKNDKQMADARVFLSDKDQVIRLLELTEAVPAAEQVDSIAFDAAPERGIPYPSAVILVNHEDWKRLATGVLPMPPEWGCFDDGVSCPRQRRANRRRVLA